MKTFKSCKNSTDMFRCDFYEKIKLNNDFKKKDIVYRK